MAELILEDIPDDDSLVLEDVPEKIKPKPETIKVAQNTSDPFKQGLAGITDAISGVPALAGMIGSAGEATYNKITEGPDINKSFSTYYDQAAADGFDKTLSQAGAGMRRFVNEGLDIEEPVSTEDQAARLLTSMILPIPGSTSTSLANKAGSFVLPLVRRTAGKPLLKDKGFAIRAGAQIGIGTGIDQGIRAKFDTPLMFSEEALAGGYVPVEDVPSDLVIDPDNKSDDSLEERLREADLKSEREAEHEAAINTLLVLGASLIAVPVASRQYKNLKSNYVQGKGGESSKFSKYIFEDIVDKSSALRDGLEKVNAPSKFTNNAVHNSHANTSDIAQEFLNTGKVADMTFDSGGITPKSIHQIEQQRTALGPERAATFDEAMKASVERVDIDKLAPGDLFPGRRTKSELDKIIKNAWSDKEIKTLMEDFGDQMEYLLRYQKHVGIIDDAGMALFRKNNTLPAIGNAPKRVAYMPTYVPNESKFLARMAQRYFGIGNKVKRDTNLQAEMMARDPNINPQTVLSPIQAIKQYTVRTMANAHEQAFKGSVLDRLSSVKLSPLTGVTTRVKSGAREAATARKTTYIGEVENLEVPPTDYKITLLKGDKASKKFKTDNLAGLQQANPGEIVTAQINGKLRVYHVPDRGLRAAIDLNPQLTNFEKVASNWKNLFTMGTTGKLSLFAPFSHAFSAQQIALNTAAANRSVLSGVASVGRSLKGTVQLGIANGAKDIADYMSKRIGRHLAEGNTPQKLIERQQKLERYYTETMLHKVRVASGRTQTGVGNVGKGSTEEVLEVYGRNIKDHIGKDQIGLFGNLWDSWNNAWHEGPAYGAMLKHIGDNTKAGKVLSPQIIRDAVDISKDLAGDMRRVGASGFARKFNAAVPFSAAMIQSWNSIGKAARANPAGFLAGATALIGAPTIGELVWNSTLDQTVKFPDPDPTSKREWTYEDYYWNGFTTQQRADNFIYMMPGVPPWEAITVPVSPEWGLFRSVVMDSIDSIFHLSAVGNMGKFYDQISVDQAKTNRSQVLQSMARVLDVPLPPLLAAGVSAVGGGVKLGLSSKISTDPDDPGAGFSLVRNIPMGRGERVTRMGGKTKFAEGYLDTTVSAIIQDIFGAAGAAYVKTAEAFMSGVTRSGEGLSTTLSNLPDTLGTGLANVGGAFVEEAKRQSRYGAILWGKSLHPNASMDEITSSLIARKTALTRLSTMDLNAYIGAGVVYSDGTPIQGDTVIAPDDPINLQLATSAKPILSDLNLYKDKEATIKKDLDTIPNARNLGTYKERQDKIDAKTLELQTLRAQQLATINHYENYLSEVLTDTYGREIVIDFSKFKPRPDFSEGSIFQVLQK